MTNTLIRCATYWCHLLSVFTFIVFFIHMYPPLIKGCIHMIFHINPIWCGQGCFTCMILEIGTGLKWNLSQVPHRVTGLKTPNIWLNTSILTLHKLGLSILFQPDMSSPSLMLHKVSVLFLKNLNTKSSKWAWPLPIYMYWVISPSALNWYND